MVTMFSSVDGVSEKVTIVTTFKHWGLKFHCDSDGKKYSEVLLKGGSHAAASFVFERNSQTVVFCSFNFGYEIEDRTIRLVTPGSPSCALPEGCTFDIYANGPYRRSKERTSLCPEQLSGKDKTQCNPLPWKE
ncbi:hypothetical protein F8388_000061 [Cannabis sativa]|uniref:S-protein homolog n=1 Tax=Cannabis sativa TaxID=3483 RepID=A0A7J6EP16_CANSA|nr:hypothetical protein F8388_000061 [Cannabis sativa]KAF4386061.1 hypothetical protein G4B88_031196 [Cannabis sativa]